MIVNGKESFTAYFEARAAVLQIDKFFLIFTLKALIEQENVKDKEVLIGYSKNLVKRMREFNKGNPEFQNPEPITPETFMVNKSLFVDQGISIDEILEPGEVLEVIHSAAWEFGIIKEAENVKLRFGAQFNETSLVGIIKQLCSEEISRFKNLAQVVRFNNILN